MEAVRSNRSHRPGSSLNKVGPSQLMWAHSQIMWAEAKLQSQIIWAQNGDDLGPTADSLRSLQLMIVTGLYGNCVATAWYDCGQPRDVAFEKRIKTRNNRAKMVVR